ncbi:MAG: FAD-binding protein [Geminicoccaceae bacterium]|nr:FAD-binding protein [Geminicoccaceae bacterium]
MSTATASVIAGLQQQFGERCTTSQAVREQHGHGESYHPTRLPDAVIMPHSTDEVAAIARLCNEHGVPIIAFGAGTSLEGHVTPLQGGISVDMREMNAIVEVHADDMDATVQAGVTRKQLNTHLRDTGLFFPVDPGADATLGGMAATRASGTNAVRYGTMRENVVSLKVVMADGSVVKTANRAKKSSAGYDLTRIFVGSEGTLGIITEVTVRLYGIPEAISSASCVFESVDAAVRTAVETIQCGIPVARVELLDTNAIRAANHFSKLSLPEKPTLFFEFHGSSRGVEEQSELVQALAQDNGSENWQSTTDPDERNRIWQARHDMHFAGLSMRPGAKVWGTDVCVPISKLPECIKAVNDDIVNAPFFTNMLGHVGDGNFHLGLLIDMDNPEELDLARHYNDRLVHHALRLGGTCTGEHGVGYGKTRFLRDEHGEEAVHAMRLLKHAYDPKNILNPGKVLPGN